MKLHSKIALIAFIGLCLLLVFSMGMQPIAKRGGAPHANRIWTCGSVPVYSLTLVP